MAINLLHKIAFDQFRIFCLFSLSRFCPQKCGNRVPRVPLFSNYDWWYCHCYWMYICMMWYWYWLRFHESFLNLKVGLQKLRSQDPSNRGHGRALIQERYWRGAFFRCLEVSRKKLVELVRITLSLPPLTDAPLPLIANSGWFLTKKSPPWSLLLVAFSKCKLAGQLKLSLGDGIAILVRKDVGNPSDYFKKRFTEYQQGFESRGKFHSRVQTESIFVKSFKT